MVLMSPSADITMSGFTEIWVEDSVAHLKTGAKWVHTIIDITPTAAIADKCI